MSDRDEGPASTDEAVLPPRGYGALMLDRTFGLMFWGKTSAVIGVWMHGLVAAIVVFEATGSALVVALVSVAQFGPQLLLAPMSGKLTDRGHGPIQIVLGRALCVLGSGALAGWFVLTARASSQPAHDSVAVLVASFVLGLGFVLGGPALTSTVPAMIRPGELAKAMTLNSVPMTAGRIIGPALGGVMAVQLGAAWAFTGAALCHVIFLALLWFIRFPARVPAEAESDLSIRAAARWVVVDRPLLRLLLAVGVAGVGAEPTLSLAPALVDSLGGTTGLVGALTTTFGVGAAAGFVLVALAARFSDLPRANVGGLLLMVAGLCLSVTPLTVVVGIGFVTIGMGFTLVFTCASTMIQERSPEQLRGRIMAFWMMGFVGARPLGALVQGAVNDLVSVHGAVVLTGALVLLTAWLCRPSTVDRPLPTAPVDSGA